MQAHQYRSAYALISTPYKAILTQKQMQMYWEKAEKARGRVISWTPRSADLFSSNQPGAIRLDYNLQCSLDNSSISINCVQENNRWLIRGLNFSG